MPSEITAQELYAMVSQWPEGARPNDLDYGPPRPTTPSHIPWEWWTYARSERDSGFRARSPISQAHAIDLHVASGIMWLVVYAHNQSAVIATSYLGYWVATDKDGPVHSAPTLFLALHAAILATKGGGK